MRKVWGSHRIVCRLLIAMATCIVLMSAAPAIGGPITDPGYSFMSIGTLGGGWSVANDINDLGQVTGESGTSAGRIVAFRTAPNAPINPLTDNLGSLGGSPADSYGEAINNLGQVAGSSWHSTGIHAYFTAPNESIVPASHMGTLGGWNSHVGAINDQGWIVGTASVVNDAPSHAFRTTSSRAINAATDDLGTLGGTNSEARDVNASGQVVGSSQIAGDVGRHAYRTLPGGVITPASDLGTLGGRGTFALGINDFGEVVGYSTLAVGSSITHAFRTAANGMILPGESDLGTLGTGASSRAAEINNSGVVVGWSEFVAANTAVHAFVHHPNGEMLDLNTLISPTTPLPTGWTLAYAMGINSSGQIAGYALDGGGNQHGFLLTPIPEPATAGVMLLLPLLALPRRERR